MPLAALRAIVGEAHAGPADAADAIDGVAPSLRVAPGSVEELSAVMRVLREKDLAVVVRGGGSKLSWGAVPSRADVCLSTARLGRVLEHAAGDLVVRAQAGVTLEALQAQVSTTDQWLALDPPEPGATLGGIVATAASGPRRHRYGAARDLLIGVTVVLADGQIAKAGGKVVKNVAGYDLCKLFTGSLGTLGVIVETAFRLHPRRSARALALLDVDAPGALGAATQALLNSALVPSAIELLWTETERGLAALFESGAAGAAAQGRQALELWSPHGRARLADDASIDGEWRRFADPRGGCASVELAGPVSRVPEMLEQATALARRHGSVARLRGRAGLGVLLADMDGPDSGLAAVVQGLRDHFRGDVHVMLRRAPPALKQAIAAWGEIAGLSLMQRVKQRFDPLALLAPGRFGAAL